MCIVWYAAVSTRHGGTDMDRHQRFALLTEEATGDREHGLPGRPRFNEGPVGIRKVRLPGGGVTKLMRVMQTNACSLSCGYCPTFRSEEHTSELQSPFLISYAV